MLTFTLVALAPVITLAIHAAVEALFTRRASLVLDSLALGTRAEATQVEYGFGNVLLLVDDRGLELPLLLEPLLGRVVHPRVQDRYRASRNFLVGAFLWSKSVEHIVFLLLAKHVHSSFQILGYQIDSASGYFLLFIITFNRLFL